MERTNQCWSKVTGKDITELKRKNLKEYREKVYLLNKLKYLALQKDDRGKEKQ